LKDISSCDNVKAAFYFKKTIVAISKSAQLLLGPISSVPQSKPDNSRSGTMSRSCDRAFEQLADLVRIEVRNRKFDGYQLEHLLNNARSTTANKSPLQASLITATTPKPSYRAKLLPMPPTPPIGAALFVTVDIVDPVLVELTSALLVGVI